MALSEWCDCAVSPLTRTKFCENFLRAQAMFKFCPRLAMILKPSLVSRRVKSQGGFFHGHQHTRFAAARQQRFSAYRRCVFGARGAAAGGETVRGTIMAVAEVIQVRRETVRGTIMAVARPPVGATAPAA